MDGAELVAGGEGVDGVGDEVADGGLFFGAEVLGGFEGEGEGVLGSAFVGVEEEAVNGDGEHDRDVAEDVEDWC